MNITYETEFVGVCPVDGTPDFYSLTIASTQTIPVEDVLFAISRATEVPSYQEEITRMISEGLSKAVSVRTVGTHSGVKVVVVA